MEREDALALVREHVDNENLIKHMLAVEAVMRKLARLFDEDENQWGLAGLLHDVDYDLTSESPKEHGLKGAEILAKREIDDEILTAVKAHNPACGQPRSTRMDHALFAVDPLTGLIVAAALIHPDKKLAEVDTEFVMNRFQEKAFARGADRDQIRSCTELDLDLEEFIALGLEAMQEIDDSLGL